MDPDSILTEPMIDRLLKNTDGAEQAHFQVLLKKLPGNIKDKDKINCAILGMKAAGLNSNLNTDGEFGNETKTACNLVEQMDPADTAGINLVLAGLLPMNQTIILDGTIGTEAIKALEAFRKFGE